jgi:hypothetical protein
LRLTSTVSIHVSFSSKARSRYGAAPPNRGAYQHLPLQTEENTLTEGVLGTFCGPSADDVAGMRKSAASKPCVDVVRRLLGVAAHFHSFDPRELFLQNEEQIRGRSSESRSIPAPAPPNGGKHPRGRCPWPLPQIKCRRRRAEAKECYLKAPGRRGLLSCGPGGSLARLRSA